MKAILYTQYGSPDLLQFKDVEKPAHKDNEVLIAIHATTVSTGDCNMSNFTFVTRRKGMGERIDDAALDSLFREARTHTRWQPRPVPDQTLRELYENRDTALMFPIVRWSITVALTAA